MLVRETRELPKHFRPKHIRCRKLYELVERRNEWTDWYGSTDLINRGPNYTETKEVDTREVMQARAEKRRKQGSHFHIRVIPALMLENEEHCFLLGEKHADKPLYGLMKHPGLRDFDKLKWPTIFSELIAFGLSRRGGFILIPNERAEVSRLEPFSAENPCLHFESVPSAKAASLGWSSCGRISTDAFDEFLSAVRRKKAFERSQQSPKK